MWLLAPISVIIIIVTLILRHPKMKGLIGERRVRKQLERLPSEDFKVLNNLLIKGKKGTVQIDHIVISPHGIFVIETKNYTGWIHGSENSEYWTQSIYRNKTKFHNPIKQNWGHIYALRETLPAYQDMPYYPGIVFVGKAKFMNLDVTTDVIYPYMLFDTITKQRDSQRLSHIDIDKIFNTLKDASIKDRQTKKDHVSRIKWNVKIRKMKERVLICPQCGRQLVKRTGRYGEFYGCNNFPECKYKSNPLMEQC
jgi:predicted RNA-binding Zn-ribbon protein involved in translation (DUF1610 family)